MKTTERYIYASAIACLVVCIGEFAFLFILGAGYPGYNHLKDTMSQLGASASPVSSIISAWWIVMGLLLISFGTGFYKAFIKKSRSTRLASLIFIFYGLGEGLGSGLFKADRIPDGIPVTTIIHDTLGGIGVLGILFLPLVMQKIITKEERPSFYRFSNIIFIIGLATILLFLCRYLPDKDNFFAVYKGLWQRMFMLNTYIFIATLAILTIREISKK
ncbi:MAG: DUF998 domain-containing protein [Bacteroidales bacterium]|nr:DUF998 domain-containing protein [Bacteroidales bacterium]